MKNEFMEYVERLIPLVRQAGAAILTFYTPRSDECVIAYKQDDASSPVTQADLAAEAIIIAGLQDLAPSFPIVAEEAGRVVKCEEKGDSEYFWLVDPLDGTREFIQRNGEFTVNIALIKQGMPVFGVVFAPALDVLYAGGVGLPAFCERGMQRQRIRCRRLGRAAIVVSSRSHNDETALQNFLHTHSVEKTLTVGSSLKFCLVAEGTADLYPRLGKTMEWDTAAAHAVLNAAGGEVVTLEGLPLRYGKKGFANPFFVAHGLKEEGIK